MRPDLIAAIRRASLLPFREMIDASQALYAPLQASEPFAGVTVVRDERYGPHERHRLDVFHGEGPGEKPVLVYVHGGSFVGGDKRIAGGIYYDNVGAWAARNGCVGVTMTYRRAPEATFPAGGEDVGSVVHWIRERIRTVGGNPEAIVLLGQSAGATHVATYIARPEFSAADAGVAGAVLLSGVYRFDPAEGPADNARAYLGTAAAAGVDLIPGFVAAKVPAIVSISEHDPAQFHRQAKALLDALYARDERVPDILFLPHHNHISQIAHLGAEGNDDPILADRLSDFLQSCAGSARSL